MVVGTLTCGAHPLYVRVLGQPYPPRKFWNLGPREIVPTGHAGFSGISSANIGLADTGFAGPVWHLCKRTTFEHNNVCGNQLKSLSMLTPALYNGSMWFC